jgi:hypothetical protein
MFILFCVGQTCIISYYNLLEKKSSLWDLLVSLPDAALSHIGAC